MQNFKPKYLIYGFTSFSTIQLIGYLGTAYVFLQQPMFLITMVLILISLLLGLLNWSKEQAKQNHKLSNAKILSCFAGSIVLITFILFGLFIGSWIAL